ncbi:MAG TPA: hypothetical protein VK851_03060 [Anaerolineales bacterium]|nr:hypothetical protein [Anaerolineales bacterium]
MNFNFGEVLTRAWQIVWKHKVLWVFGILASCGQGSGGGNSGGGNSGFDMQSPDLPPQVMRWLQMVEQNIQTYIAIGIALFCVIWIVAVFLSTIGKIGLIRGTSQADENVESLIFGQLFSESTPYFWRVLGLTLILGLPVFIFAVAVAVFVVFAVVGIVGSGQGNEPLAVLGIVPLVIGCVCLLIPIMFVLRMIFRQAERAVVLEDMAVLPSLSRGWEVFRANLGPIIVMAIILAVIGFVVGIVIALPILLVVVPAAMAFTFGNGQGTMPIMFMVACICLYIPVLLLLNGIVTAYIESAWTLTYMRITNPQDATPEIVEANA